MAFALRSSVAFACLVLSQWSLAFSIADIRIEGLKRVSSERVFAALPVQAGQTYTASMGAQTIRSLFELGFFRDVTLEQDGNDLVIQVSERPAIARVVFTGNKIIPDEALRDVLRGAGVAEGEVLLQSTLDRLQTQLAREYEGQGRYDATVETRTRALPDNRIGIELDINEGQIATIGRIRFIGVEQVDVDDLRDAMELTEPGAFTFFSKRHRFNRQRLAGDVERIRSVYFDQGFARVDVKSSTVQLDPQSQTVFLTILVDEGRVYTLGDVRVAGELPPGIDSLDDDVSLTVGELYRQRDVSADAEGLKAVLGRSGFTGANVREVPEFDDQAGTVDLTYLVEPGLKTYVRRIEFKGNEVTADPVMRRNLVQLEGAVADTGKIELSRSRLERLGFFSRVSPSLKPVPGSPDQADLEIEVEEQSTGSFSASVGYSQSSGAVFGVELAQDNFLGSGNNVKFGVNKSDAVQQLSFSFFDPFLTVDGVSRGIDAFYRQTDFQEEGSSSYSIDETGVSVNFGYPISEYSRVGFSGGLLMTDLKLGANLAPGGSAAVGQITTFQNDVAGKESFTELQTGIYWQRSTLNRGLLPTDGSYQRVNFDLSIPGSDLQYYTTGYDGERYFNLAPEKAIRVRGRVAFGDGMGDLSTIPFFRNYFAGGQRSVRGYESNSLGPRSDVAAGVASDPFGGNLLITGGVDYQLAAPFVDNPRSNRLSVFVDMGQVYDSRENIDLGELRASAGVAFTWITAIGPLSFSYATPLNEKTGDKTETFQFSIGTGL